MYRIVNVGLIPGGFEEVIVEFNGAVSNEDFRIFIIPDSGCFWSFVVRVFVSHCFLNYNE